jgi:hypothetical protein
MQKAPFSSPQGYGGGIGYKTLTSILILTENRPDGMPDMKVIRRRIRSMSIGWSFSLPS